MGLDEQAKAVLEVVLKVQDKCLEIEYLAESVFFAVDGIKLTDEQKQRIITLYQNKKTELESLVAELP